MSASIVQTYRAFAYNNAWANHRLLAACQNLSQAEFEAVRIGFFGKPHEINPSITVKPGEPPGNQSVSDFVSSKPGTYTMSLAVVATPTPTGQAQNIRDQVSVSVK